MQCNLIVKTVKYLCFKVPVVYSSYADTQNRQIYMVHAQPSYNRCFHYKSSSPAEFTLPVSSYLSTQRHSNIRVNMNSVPIVTQCRPTSAASAVAQYNSANRDYVINIAENSSELQRLSAAAPKDCVWAHYVKHKPSLPHGLYQSLLVSIIVRCCYTKKLIAFLTLF